MANTTNYNWETPDDTDLVKDGAAAIRTLGSSIDTTTKNLNPQTTTGALAYRSATANVNTALPIGTAGQILAVSGGVPAWINNDQGDITEVAAGTGISVASGTGPVPTVSINTAVTADLTTAQTLTNKTLTSPVLTTPTISTIDAKGDLLVGTADNTIGRLAVGTNDYVLTADSTVSPTGLKWAAPASSGGMTSLAADNLPAASTVTLSTISGSYVDLVLYVRDFYFAADDYLCIRVNGDTGSSYGWIGIFQSAENTAAVSCDGIRDRLFAAGDDGKEDADRNTFCGITFADYANTSHKKTIDIRTIVRDQTNTYDTQFMVNGNFNGSAAITSITLFTQNGSNFSGGSYVLYGVK